MPFLHLGTNSLLRRRPNFGLFFAADTLAKVADSYFLLLLPFLLADLTGSGTVLGLVLALNGLARGLASLYGGVLADRYQPQRILLWNNALQALGLAGLALFLFSRQTLVLPALILLSTGFGVIDGVAAPASQAAGSKIVPPEDLLEANSYLQGLEQLTAIAGPVLAGWLLATQGTTTAVIVGTGLYLLSVFGLAPLYKRNLLWQAEVLGHHTSFRKQFLEGLTAARSNRIVQASLGLLIINNLLITGPVVLGLLLLYQTRFGYGADVYAYSGVLFSLGFLVGVPLVTKLTKRFKPSRILLTVYCTYAVCLSIIGWAPHLAWIMVAYFLVGPAVALDTSITSTWQQSAISNRLTGRVGSLAAIAALALDPLSQALTGWGSDWSVAGVFYASGWGLLGGFLLLYGYFEELRNIRLPEPVVEEN